MVIQCSEFVINECVFIIGVSSGIGLYLVYCFVVYGYLVCLVVFDVIELDVVVVDICKVYGVEVMLVVVDLEKKEVFVELDIVMCLVGWLIDILVNNVGYGFCGWYVEVLLLMYLLVLWLNVEVVMCVILCFLLCMVKNCCGWVFNIVLIVGFELGLGMVVYYVSKVFILLWSEVLVIELEGSGVIVIVLCFGFVDIDFFFKGDLQQSFVFQKVNLMDLEDVVYVGYGVVMVGECVVVLGVVNKVLVFLCWFMFEYLQFCMNEKMYEDVDEVYCQCGECEFVFKG